LTNSINEQIINQTFHNVFLGVDARFSFQKSNDGNVNGVDFKFHKNRFMPSQEKVYQNPCVVQKMALDFSELKLPCMHVDCTVKFYGHTLVWTIYMHLLNHHRAVHLTYRSDSTGLSLLPEKTSDIKSCVYKYQQCKQYALHADSHKKHKLFSLLDTHAEMLYENLDKREMVYDKKKSQLVGYVYEFNPRFTVICSTFYKVSKAAWSRECITAYTIVQWNTLKTKKQDSEKFKQMQLTIKTITREQEDLRVAMHAITPLCQQVACFSDLDFFVSAISENGREIGGLLFTKPTYMQRMHLESCWKRLHIQIRDQLSRTE
jgi:hypothetical protein